VTLLESITGSDYEALAEFRYQIRRFLHFSEMAARERGIEPQQHQLLLAIRGSGGQGEPPSIGTLAERLQIQHHSAVELVDRLVERGLVVRSRGPSDRRQVLVHLTPRGESELEKLTVYHLAELRTNGPALVKALEAVVRRNHDGN
jgi:DNA-binding MarR family transcriptional regulator